MWKAAALFNSGPGAYSAQCARHARHAQHTATAARTLPPDGFLSHSRHLLDTDWTGPYLWPSCPVCECVYVRGHIGVTLQPHARAHGPAPVEDLLSRGQPLDLSRRVRLCSAVERHRTKDKPYTLTCFKG